LDQGRNQEGKNMNERIEETICWCQNCTCAQDHFCEAKGCSCCMVFTFAGPCHI